MNASRALSVAALRWMTLLAAALAICLLFIITVRDSPPPTIDQAFGETSIFIAADRDWTLLPGDCLNIRWRLEGIASLHVDGAGKIGADETRFCPEINATSPLFEVRAQDGVYRSFRLDIHHLPDLLFYLAGFVLLLGSPALALYYFCRRRLDGPPSFFWLLLGAMLLTALGAGLRLTPHEPPLIDDATGDLTLRLWAEHDRALFPHECVKVWWSVAGAQSVRFNGFETARDENPASAEHCAEAGDYAEIEVVNQAGESETYRLPIRLSSPPGPPPPPFFYVSLIGIALGALIYAPLFARYLRAWRRQDRRADAAAVFGCFFVVLVLYLPFGFDSSGHWEEWIIHGYIEGGTLSFYVTEAVSRPFVMIPHTLAYLISADSFIGHHIISYLQYAGRMALLYLILRQLGAPPFYAFWTAMLFMFYPVNDALMTLRRLPKNFSVLTLLLSTALFLDYCRHPRRLTLLGIWLGLLFCVNTNETGYVLLLVVPLPLWLRERSITWRSLNLSAIWYIAPAFKLASVVLLLAAGRDFYQSGILTAEPDLQASSSLLQTFIDVLGIVYPQTFLYGWRDALAALPAAQWWLPSAVILAAIACIASYLYRNSIHEPAPAPKQFGFAFLGGLLLVMAAVGVLMWLPLYSADPWRMYLFVPIGAAIALFSLLLLAASPARHHRRRHLLIGALCLLFMAPAVSRLFVQHSGFVQSADSKAGILRQIMATAPEFAPTTQVALITPLDHSELRALGIGELLRNDMLNSAMHVLYQAGAPELAYFCAAIDRCGEFSGDDTIFSAPADLLGRTLVFLLHEDLRVELIEDPAAFLGLDLVAEYDASALYVADAPLPPRARTMLARASSRLAS